MDNVEPKSESFLDRQAQKSGVFLIHFYKALPTKGKVFMLFFVIALPAAMVQKLAQPGPEAKIERCKQLVKNANAEYLQKRSCTTFLIERGVIKHEN